MAAYGQKVEARPRAACISWLWQLLRDAGGELPATEVKARATEAGFSERTLRRAKHDLGIGRGRTGFGPGGRYVWRLPRRYIRHRPYVSQPKRRPLLDQPLDVLPLSILGPGHYAEGSKSPHLAEWLRRVRAWQRLTGDARTGEPRYFDPVLCECATRWFTAPGYTVIDPYARSPAPGIVAARLGRPYTGLAPDAAAAATWTARYAKLAGRPAFRAASTPPIWHAPADPTAWLQAQPAASYDFVLTRHPTENPIAGQPVTRGLPELEGQAADASAVGAALRLLRDDRYAFVLIPHPGVRLAVTVAGEAAGVVQHGAGAYVPNAATFEHMLVYRRGDRRRAVQLLPTDQLVWPHYRDMAPGWRPA